MADARSSLARKLGIKPGFRVELVEAPDHVPALLAPLPPDVALARTPGSEADRRADLLLLFARDADALHGRLDGAVERIDADGGLWIAWPKKSSSLASPDLDRAVVQEAGLATGLVDNKVCAVDQDWSALRFVHRLEDRPRVRASRRR